MTLKFKLSGLMFIQLFVYGAFIPIVSLYLQSNLGFSSIQTGWILAASATASLLSPILIAFAADRIIPAERLLALCHIVAACLMAVFLFQKEFVPVLVCYFLYNFTVSPTSGLLNTAALHHTSGTREGYSNIRVWGTIGWIAAAWSFGLAGIIAGPKNVSILPLGFIIAACTSVVMAGFSLTLPVAQTEVQETGILPRSALKVLARPQILALGIFSFTINFIDRFYYLGTAPYLKHLNFPEAVIMPAMSLGQVVEIISMMTCAPLIKKIGVKKLILIGMIAEFLRYTSYAVGHPAALLIAGLSIHGMTFAWVYIPALIYLDSHCERSSRAGVQQLFNILTSGIGCILGNWFVGMAGQLLTLPSGMINYPLYWVIPAGLSALVLVGIVIFIRKD